MLALILAFIPYNRGTVCVEIPQLATIIVTSCYFSFCSAPSSPPSKVVFTQLSKNQLTISWTAPPRDSWNGQWITYQLQICYSYNARSRNPTCSSEKIQSSTAVIKNLRPGTRYFVTVAAGTSAGYGPKSTEVSEITRDGGKTPICISIQSNNSKMTGNYFLPTNNIYTK